MSGIEITGTTRLGDGPTNNAVIGDTSTWTLPANVDLTFGTSETMGQPHHRQKHELGSERKTRHFHGRSAQCVAR